MIFKYLLLKKLSKGSKRHASYDGHYSYALLHAYQYFLNLFVLYYTLNSYSLK